MGGRSHPGLGAHTANGHWTHADVQAAWAEMDKAGQSLAKRERELAQREAAVRRAEMRQRMTARQLNELQQRLDDYNRELEEGVVELTAQQNALREERRQTVELQARARRMCLAAARDESSASVCHASIRTSSQPVNVRRKATPPF